MISVVTCFGHLNGQFPRDVLPWGCFLKKMLTAISHFTFNTASKMAGEIHQNGYPLFSIEFARCRLLKLRRVSIQYGDIFSLYIWLNFRDVLPY